MTKNNETRGPARRSVRDASLLSLLSVIPVRVPLQIADQLATGKPP
jgi:hypothetical protein